MADAPHYLSLGELMQARLRAELGTRWPSLAVYGIRDLAELGEQGQRPFSVSVLYAGDALNSPQARGAAQTIRQRWAVVPAVTDLRRAADAADQMGPLIDACLAALMGWQAAPDYAPLERVAAPAPRYPRGQYLVPIYFEARLLRYGARLTD